MKTLLPFIPERDALIQVEKVGRQSPSRPQRNLWEREKLSQLLPHEMTSPFPKVRRGSNQKTKTPRLSKWHSWSKNLKSFFNKELNLWFVHPPVVRSFPTLCLFLGFTLLLVIYQLYTQGTI